MTSQKRKVQKGFTLIELMIVVAIIGVLSAIAVPAYQNYVKKSEASVGLSTARSLLTNVDMFVQETGAFPTDPTDIGATEEMNALGKIAIDPTDEDSEFGTVKFTFDDTSTLNTKLITFTKTDDGWSCSNTTGQELKSCVTSS